MQEMDNVETHLEKLISVMLTMSKGQRKLREDTNSISETLVRMESKIESLVKSLSKTSSSFSSLSSSSSSNSSGEKRRRLEGESSSVEALPRKRGRPKAEAAATTPPLTAPVSTPAKRKPGRPRKVTTLKARPEANQPRAQRSRRNVSYEPFPENIMDFLDPSLVQVDLAPKEPTSAKRKVGRPRKDKSDSVKTKAEEKAEPAAAPLKRGRGRPKKVVIENTEEEEEEEEEDDDDDDNDDEGEMRVKLGRKLVPGKLEKARTK